MCMHMVKIIDSLRVMQGNASGAFILRGQHENVYIISCMKKRCDQL